LNINLEKQTETHALIKINLKEDDYQPSVNQKIKEYSKKVNLKGFRPGKVPAGMIRKMYGKSILVEEINRILSESLKKYINENDLQIIGEPLPDQEASKNIDWDQPGEMEFRYEIGLVEDFDPGLSKKNKVKRYKIKVDKKLVDETIDNLQNQYADFEEVEKSGKEDIINGELTHEDGSKTHEATISESNVKSKEWKKFIGLKNGDEINFDVSKVADGDNNIAFITGVDIKEVDQVRGEWKLKVKKIQRKKPAEINQEFFDKLFGKDNVKSTDEFREKVKEVIEKNYSQETEALLTRDIQQTLIDTAKLNLPDEFLRKWLMATDDKITEEQLENEYESYSRELKWNLIKNKIGKEHDITVEHEDVVARTKEMINQQFGQSGLAGLGDKMDDFADNYLKGNDGQNYMQIYNQVFADKIMELVKDKIELKEEEVSLDKVKKVLKK
jgi:trigger factor